MIWVDCVHRLSHFCVAANEALYPAVMHEVARVLRRGGRAVLLTSAANQHLMARTVGSCGSLRYCWSRVQCRALTIGFKMQAHIYVLHRSDSTIRPLEPSTPQAIESDEQDQGAYPFKPDNPDYGFGDEPLDWEQDGGKARWDVQWVSSAMQCNMVEC